MDSETSTSSYDGSARLAVTGITVLGDGMGRAKGRRVAGTVPLRGLSNPLQFMVRTLVHHVPGIQCSSRLKQQEPALLIGDGFVLHSSRNHDELTLFNPDVAVAKLHPKAAPNILAHTPVPTVTGATGCPEKGPQSAS